MLRNAACSTNFARGIKPVVNYYPGRFPCVNSVTQNADWASLCLLSKLYEENFGMLEATPALETTVRATGVVDPQQPTL